MISSSPTRRGINIFAAEGAPVVAVNDGVIKKIGDSPELGKYVVLQDAYGNRFTYAELGQIVRDHRTVVMPSGKREAGPGRQREPAPPALALPERADGEQAAEKPARKRRRSKGRRNPQGRVEGYCRHGPGPDRQLR